MTTPDELRTMIMESVPAIRLSTSDEGTCNEL